MGAVFLRNWRKQARHKITGIARNAAGKIFLCTANPGKVVTLGPEYEPERNLRIASFDAQLFRIGGALSGGVRQR